MSSTNPKIIIIGAGAAGIAAATRLLENGINDIIVLEAENRIGGRVHSVEFGGSVVDLGGQWCHGEEGNVVYEMVKDLNLLSPSQNNYSDFTYYLSNGTVIDKAITNHLVKIADDVFEDEEAARKTEGTFGDYFIKE
ncbi:Amino oxidase and/or NAD binding 8 domain containing protein [Asbolus verrucosus]|uniref:Amino oxidase and/or NAD binding 8 domain containing protein n=1 Tax=Asbolus verrucosus TaxID=1661398 RepID=A0A482VQ96_ASBVE|nr:Amino oxidase and/or NAD binding 8 domain containing protein [Asbolus verrucosus]